MLIVTLTACTNTKQTEVKGDISSPAKLSDVNSASLGDSFRGRCPHRAAGAVPSHCLVCSASPLQGRAPGEYKLYMVEASGVSVSRTPDIDQDPGYLEPRISRNPDSANFRPSPQHLLQCNTSRGGGGGVVHLGQFLLGMCRWPLRASTYTPLVIVYSVANYRPHLSHFCGNVNFAIPT